MLELVIVLNLLNVLDGQPARTLDFSLQDEKLKHTLVSSEQALESIARQIAWQRRLARRVLDFQEFVIAMGNRHFKAVLSVDHFAFESRDILEPILSQVIKLYDHAVLLSFLFFGSKGASHLILGKLWEGKNGSLHSMNFE